MPEIRLNSEQERFVRYLVDGIRSAEEGVVDPTLLALAVGAATGTSVDPAQIEQNPELRRKFDRITSSGDSGGTWHRLGGRNPVFYTLTNDTQQDADRLLMFWKDVFARGLMTPEALDHAENDLYQAFDNFKGNPEAMPRPIFTNWQGLRQAAALLARVIELKLQNTNLQPQDKLHLEMNWILMLDRANDIPGRDGAMATLNQDSHILRAVNLLDVVERRQALRGQIAAAQQHVFNYNTVNLLGRLWYATYLDERGYWMPDSFVTSTAEVDFTALAEGLLRTVLYLKGDKTLRGRDDRFAATDTAPQTMLEYWYVVYYAARAARDPQLMQKVLGDVPRNNATVKEALTHHEEILTFWRQFGLPAECVRIVPEEAVRQTVTDAAVVVSFPTPSVLQIGGLGSVRIEMTSAEDVAGLLPLLPRMGQLFVPGTTDRSADVLEAMLQAAERFQNEDSVKDAIKTKLVAVHENRVADTRGQGITPAMRIQSGTRLLELYGDQGDKEKRMNVLSMLLRNHQLAEERNPYVYVHLGNQLAAERTSEETFASAGLAYRQARIVGQGARLSDEQRLQILEAELTCFVRALRVIEVGDTLLDYRRVLQRGDPRVADTYLFCLATFAEKGLEVTVLTNEFYGLRLDMLNAYLEKHTALSRDKTEQMAKDILADRLTQPQVKNLRDAILTGSNDRLKKTIQEFEIRQEEVETTGSDLLVLFVTAAGAAGSRGAEMTPEELAGRMQRMAVEREAPQVAAAGLREERERIAEEPRKK